MSKLKFYIKERHNPQFKKPYYVPENKRTREYVARQESGEGYGYNIMLAFNTESEYRDKIKSLKSEGFNVHHESTI